LSINYGKWLADAKEAYKYTLLKFECGDLEITDIKELYTIAPLVAAEKNQIDDAEIIREMCDFISENAEQDFSVDEGSKNHYKFHFVISFINSHVPPEIITEMEGDRIMEYINDEWELFD